jgi:hypothetical protein
MSSMTPSACLSHTRARVVASAKLGGPMLVSNPSTFPAGQDQPCSAIRLRVRYPRRQHGHRNQLFGHCETVPTT